MKALHMSRLLEVIELVIRSGTYKVCDSMRPALLLFVSRRVCVIHKREFIMHRTIRWLTLKQSINIVLIVECLFAKAWALEAPPSSPGATAHLHLKQHTQLFWCFGSYPKSGHFNKLYKMLCGVFWAQISHTLWGHQILILYLVKRGIIGPF